MTADERTFILELANRQIDANLAEDINATLTAEVRRIRLAAEAGLKQVEGANPASTSPGHSGGAG